jgi:GPH family glycoside/pentoside/hexuronide:cation symporter
MLPDTVEYGEWRSGVRAESLIFGCGVLAQKVALGVGAGVLGLALKQIGYVPNELQSAATLNDLKQLMFWVPLIGGLVSAALVYFYPIGLKEHARIVEEIAARKLQVSE